MRIRVGRSSGFSGMNSPRCGLAAESAAITCKIRWKCVNVCLTSPKILPIRRKRRAQTAAIPAVAGKAQHPAQQAPIGPPLQQNQPAARRHPSHALPHGFFRLCQFARQFRSNAKALRLASSPTAGKSHKPDCAACRSSPPDPSPLAHNLRAADRASPTPPAAPVPALPPAAAPLPQTAAPSPARHCHRPPPQARHSKSPPPPPPYRARPPARPASQPPTPETPRHDRAPPPARRRADCGRGRSSQARPIPPSHRHRPPQPDPPPLGQRAIKR